MAGTRDNSQLNDKQMRFCHEYLVDLHITNAALRAGYSERSAASQGARLLKNRKIQDKIAELRDRREKAIDITAARVVQEIAKVAFASLDSFIGVTDDGTPFVQIDVSDKDSLAALSEITVNEFVDGRGKDIRDVKSIKIKLADKLRALDMLMKHIGGYEPSKVDVSSQGEGAQVVIFLPEKDDPQS